MHLRACALVLFASAAWADPEPAGTLVRAAALRDASGEDVRAAQDAVVAMGQTATGALAALLDDPGAGLDARLVALRLLGRIGGAEALDAIGGVATRSDEPALRWAAAETLATFDGDEPVRWLVPLLWDPTTASTSLWLLSERATPDLIPVFAAGLADPALAAQALMALAAVCTPEAEQLIATVAERGDPATYLDAVAGLLRCGGPVSVAQGVERAQALAEEDRARVADRLLASRPDPVALRSVLDTSVPRAVLGDGEVALAARLALVDAPGAAQVLAAAPWRDAVIDAALRGTRRDASSLVRLTRDPRARAAARSVLRGERQGAWGAALDVLGEARDADDVAVLAACLAEPLDRSQPCLRLLALASRGAPEAVGALEDALDGRLPVTEGLDLVAAAWLSGAPSLVDRVRGRRPRELTAGLVEALARRPVGPQERAALLGALGGPDARAALDTLGSSGDGDAVGAIAAWTSRASAEDRGAGLRALGLVGTDRAVAALAPIARKPGHPDRLAAVQAIALVRTAASSTLLAQMLDPVRPDLFVAAAEGLAERPADVLPPVLLSAAWDADERVALAAIRALVAAGELDRARDALNARAGLLSREGLVTADGLLAARPLPSMSGAAPGLAGVPDLPALIAGAASRAPVAALVRSVVDGASRGDPSQAVIVGLASWDPEVRELALTVARSLCGEERAALEAALRDAPPPVPRQEVRAALDGAPCPPERW